MTETHIFLTQKRPKTKKDPCGKMQTRQNTFSPQKKKGLCGKMQTGQKLKTSFLEKKRSLREDADRTTNRKYRFLRNQKRPLQEDADRIKN